MYNINCIVVDEWMGYVNMFMCLNEQRHQRCWTFTTWAIRFYEWRDGRNPSLGCLKWWGEEEAEDALFRHYPQRNTIYMALEATDSRHLVDNGGLVGVVRNHKWRKTNYIQNMQPSEICLLFHSIICLPVCLFCLFVECWIHFIVSRFHSKEIHSLYLPYEARIAIYKENWWFSLILVMGKRETPPSNHWWKTPLLIPCVCCLWHCGR